MGNIELHLIKGKPHTKRGQHPDDLIVCHLALEVTDASAVLQRLEQMQVGGGEELRGMNYSLEQVSWRRHWLEGDGKGNWELASYKILGDHLERALVMMLMLITFQACTPKFVGLADSLNTPASNILAVPWVFVPGEGTHHLSTCPDASFVIQIRMRDKHGVKKDAPSLLMC